MKMNLQAECHRWDKERRTDSKWKPPQLSSRGGVKNWGNHEHGNYKQKFGTDPIGTDPITAYVNFWIYRRTGIQTKALHTSAIGNFDLNITVDDDIICQCKTATLDIWMYNDMSRDSFGGYDLPETGIRAYPVFSAIVGPNLFLHVTYWQDYFYFKNGSKERQHMWWNWKREISWE